MSIISVSSFTIFNINVYLKHYNVLHRPSFFGSKVERYDLESFFFFCSFGRQPRPKVLKPEHEGFYYERKRKRGEKDRKKHED